MKSLNQFVRWLNLYESGANKLSISNLFMYASIISLLVLIFTKAPLLYLAFANGLLAIAVLNYLFKRHTEGKKSEQKTLNDLIRKVLEDEMSTLREGLNRTAAENITKNFDAVNKELREVRQKAEVAARPITGRR